MLLTVATDPAWMYTSEMAAHKAKLFNGEFDEVSAGEVFGAYLTGVATDNLEELTHQGRERVFNLGYYTWVEQQGVSVADFEARRDQKFWRNMRAKYIPIWEELIKKFNEGTGLASEGRHEKSCVGGMGCVRG